jgi:asparagine synthase (glutamine-hydrolysing)
MWGTKCFARLIGDWALSVWDPRSRSVILAKDPIGTRHLFYSSDEKHVTWSTILDPLILLAGKTFTLEEEYIAGWLSFFPATHLTPYVGIHSVPPSCFVRLEPGQQTVDKYWDFDSSKRIRYRTDREYEEHFRQAFEESVRRRLRSDRPILAELSGGMDSSSIVCMADSLIARGVAETSRLDTLSHYNDSEPDWNERLYFTKVEEKRGRIGCHIDVSNKELFKLELESNHFAATPGSQGHRFSEASRQFTACISSRGNRVVLSGIGGDEVAGGVPTAAPELDDLLAKGHFRTFAHQVKVWALSKRKPWLHVVLDTAREFFPTLIVGVPKQRRPAIWLDGSFVKRNRGALQGYQSRVKLFGPLPSFASNLNALGVLRRQAGCVALMREPLCEKRYPYLDREFLELIYALPPEQLIRPGQRRSLMRRAFADVVPSEILDRRRKAFMVRTPRMTITDNYSKLLDKPDLEIVSIGIVNSERFHETFENLRKGRETPVVPLLRMIEIETWLQNLRGRGLANTEPHQLWNKSGISFADGSSSIFKRVKKSHCVERSTGPKKDPLCHNVA